MKKVLIFLMILFKVFFASAQQKKTDSLITVLNALPGNAKRIPVLIQLSEQQNDADNIFKYGNEGLQLAVKLGRQKDEELFLFAIGGGYFKTDNYPKDLELCYKGLALSEKLKDTIYSCQFLKGISVAYNDAGESRKALNYGLKGLKLAVKLENKAEMMSFSNNISDFYGNLNLLDSALYYGKESYRIAKKSSNPNIGYPLLDLGGIEYKLGHLQLALSYSYQSIPYFSKNNFYRVKNLSNAFESLAEIYRKLSRNDSAFFYADTAYKIASKGKELVFVNQSAMLLSALYEGKNDKESLRYYKIATAAKDSLNSADKAKQFQVLNFQQQEREHKLKAEAETYQDNLRLYGVLVVLIAALVISGILWNNYKKQLAANKLMQKQQDELKATQTQLIQSEKMASLGELTAGIAHEIQNPLNFVNNFSEVNAELIDELEAEIEKGDLDEIKAIAVDIRENEKKINLHGKRADAIVKGMLQHSKASNGIKKPTNINALADEYLKLAYYGMQVKDKTFNAVPIAIGMVTHFDEKLPQINVINQDIARVMLNLFNNAFYAVHQKVKTGGPDYKPTIEVASFFLPLQGVGGLRVRDNGIGIPDAIKDKIMQPFFTTKPTGEGTGLGLSLTYDIVVKGHGGSIQVNSVEGEGSEFTVILPL